MERFTVQGPYALALSLEMSSRFTSSMVEDPPVLRTTVRADGTPLLMEVRQVADDPPVLEVDRVPEGHAVSLRGVAEWMLFADLDLKPFYRRVGDHRVLGSVVRRLAGLKPIRPPTIFEMAVTAVTEQQISMTAACHIRSRLVQAYGEKVAAGAETDEGSPHYAFPTPERLAAVSLEDLQDCGLSLRKAEYVAGLARGIVDGVVDPEGWKELPDAEVHAAVTDLRGFGSWSADYILVRGLGRMDCVPASDLGVRSVVGSYLGGGARATADKVRELVVPFKPYRGLTAFYLLAFSRVQKAERHSARPGPG